jgi:hypothetical protein
VKGNEELDSLGTHSLCGLYCAAAASAPLNKKDAPCTVTRECSDVSDVSITYARIEDESASKSLVQLACVELGVVAGLLCWHGLRSK